MRKYISKARVFFQASEEKNMTGWIYKKKKHKVWFMFLPMIHVHYRNENFTSTWETAVTFCAPSEMEKRLFFHLRTWGKFDIYTFKDKYWLFHLSDQDDMHTTKKYGLNCMCWCDYFQFELNYKHCIAPNFSTRKLRNLDVVLSH